MRFIEFLFEQLNVTVDPSDPAGSLQKVKNMLKTGARDPIRAQRARQQDIQNRDSDIEKEEDPDVMKSREDIQKDEQRVARKRMQLAQLQKKKEQEKERQIAAGV